MNTEIEEIQRKILLKWEFIHMTRNEIADLEGKRLEMLEAELSERKALNRLQEMV